MAGEGLGLSTLGATRLEVRGLRMMRSIPSWLFSFLRMGKQFGRNAERLRERIRDLRGNSRFECSANGFPRRACDAVRVACNFRVWARCSADDVDSRAGELGAPWQPGEQRRATEAIRRIAAGAPESYPRRDQRRAAFLLRFGRPAREAAKSGRLQPNVLGSLSNATIDR